MNNTVDNIYQLRNDFLIIGLTGQTGSGCSSVANLLKGSFQGIFPPSIEKRQEGLSNDDRKYNIVRKYLLQNWVPFEIIKASDIIFYYALLGEYKDLSIALSGPKPKDVEFENVFSDKFKKQYDLLKEKAKLFEEFITCRKSQPLRTNKEGIDELVAEVETKKKFIFNEVPALRKQFNDELSLILRRKPYREYQEWGNNVRKYNSIIKKDNESLDPSSLAKHIDLLVKMLRDYNQYKNKPTFIIIDALRNPYEVLYFKERYSAFYLMSVNTSDTIRREKLFSLNYRKEEIEELDAMEHPSKSKEIDKSFYTQDVERCIELSDIFVTHNGTEVVENIELKKQLIRYIALMRHPGIISPSPQERIMQVANAAKLNSGCISRQVGAAVTDNNYSLKSIGWNTVPQGQTPCTLCDFMDLVNRTDATAFSDYERTDEKFRIKVDRLAEKYKSKGEDKPFSSRFMNSGLTCSFCFKDIHTSANQVHTRSLHAEENAFLQIAKYGGQALQGGKLFTTASCCELCAKKAYQLGIKEIYYIDAYPGISLQHILNNGTQRPSMILFSGAIGHAYERLYTPLLPLKDEIAYLTEVKVKDVTKCTEAELAKKEEEKRDA